MAIDLPERSALLVIDVQRGLDDPSLGARDNPACEANIAKLLAAWRERGWPTVFVRHDSRIAGSPLAPGHPGNAFKDVVSGKPDLLVVKSVNSAFYGEPSLEPWLRERSITGLVICGITANQCCETTARMAGNLGFETFFALDATHAFERFDLEGVAIPAAQITRITGANLQEEFASVVSTA